MSSSDSAVEPNPPRRSYAQRARTLAAIYFVLLATATHLPTVPQSLMVASDKVHHFVAYALLAICVLAGWELTIGKLEPKHYFAVWLAGTLYGIVDEFTQIPVGRSCDVHDWLADVCGVVSGLIAYQVLRGMWRSWG